MFMHRMSESRRSILSWVSFLENGSKVTLETRESFVNKKYKNRVVLKMKIVKAHPIKICLLCFGNKIAFYNVLLLLTSKCHHSRDQES